MDQDAKKAALRMIPYGLYVLTAETKGGEICGATVNWVTQTSFEPPLVVIGLKKDSSAHSVVREAGAFALNVLGKGQQGLAFAFFKPAAREGDTIAGQPFRSGVTGAPVLEEVPAHIECRVVEFVENGDHSVVLAEVVEAGLKEALEGRPDAHTLRLEDLGEKTFYGG